MKKIGKINVVMLFFSAFVILCYFPYLINATVHGERVSSLIIPIAVIVLASVPAVLFVKMRDRLNKFLQAVRIIYIVGMCFYFVTFTLFVGYIAINSHNAAFVDAYTEADDSGDGDIVLVFGCRTYGYTPGRPLKARLDAAKKILDARAEAICIVSGGEGENEGVAEAYSMKKYLCDNGIAPERIYTEANSRNTYENITMSMELIEKEGLEYDSIIGVSTDFHLPRIEYLFEHYEIEATTAAAPSSDAWEFFMHVVREYMAYVKLFIVT